MMATRRNRRTAWAAGVAAVVVLGTGAACSAGSSDGDGGTSGSDDAAGTAQVEAAQSVAEPAAADRDAALVNDDGAAAQDAPGQGVLEQAVISQGAVQLRAKDVGGAVFDIRQVVDLHAGVVEQNATETDDDGDPLRSRMVLRIPAAEFDEAMGALEEISVLVASSSTSEDVTTKVLDTEVRVDAQRRSIRRIAVLLDRATSIRDIVNIESELSRRQADLASLEKQQRYLLDQTSMSTITVSVERTEKKAPKAEPEDHTGFLAGLGAGWSGLQTFGVGLATVTGALLPWLVVLLVLAVPGWPLLRRLRRRQASTA